MTSERKIQKFIAKEIARQLRAGGVDHLLRVHQAAQLPEVVGELTGTGTLSATVAVVPTVRATAVVLAPEINLVAAELMAAMWQALPAVADRMEKRPDEATALRDKAMLLLTLLSTLMLGWQTFHAERPTPTQIFYEFKQSYNQTYGPIDWLDDDE